MGVQRRDLPIEHEDFGKLLPCETCGAGRKTEYLQKLSRLRGTLADASLEEWKPLPGAERVVKDAVSYLFRKGDDAKATGWMTLSGPSGTGKTHLLAAMVNHFIAIQRPAVYITMQELLETLRQAYRPDARALQSTLWRDITEEAEVLAIDELEKFAGTQWAQEQVFALLNQRYDLRNKTLTLLATNEDLRQPGVRLLPTADWDDEYIISRIRDGRNLLLTDFWYADDVRPTLREEVL
jgi:DNA replication protein DnaC